MTRSRRRGLRGYLLMEAMISEAVLLIALASVLGVVTAGQRKVAAATADQQAWLCLREHYELQRAARLTGPDWAIGTRSGTCPSQDAAPWTWTVAVVAVADAAVTGVSPLAYRKATVSLAYRGRTISLELLKW